MRPGIELRTDYDAARLRALAKSTRHAGQSRLLLALARSTPAARGPGRRGSAGLGCRRCATGWCASTPAGLTACSTARPRHHAKSEAAVAVIKKSFPRVRRGSRPRRLMASRSRSGLPTRHASGRRTRLPGAGLGAAPVPPPRET